MPKKRVNIPMTLKDIDDFDSVRQVAEEYRVDLERAASDIGAQFRSRPADHDRQRCQLSALLLKLGNKTTRDGQMPALPSDVTLDVQEILTRRGQIN